MERTSRLVPTRILAVDPPFDATPGLLFGLQDRAGVVDAQPATGTTRFDTVIEIVDGDPVDFRGDHVHGRRGDRFIYLSWGVADGVQPFVMFARTKIKLADVPTELIAGSENGGLVCEIIDIAKNGAPVTGTIKPPRLRWRSRP